MEVILDTNALTAFADGEPGALAEIGRARLIAIPVVVLGEYLFGIAQSRRRNEYEQWMKRYIRDYHILDVNSDTAAQYADVRLQLKRAGTPIPPNDTWIAALCRQHSLPLLSQDRHFDRVNGIRRVGW
jgi:tRNA(fMet)-specific endonuclease VapC